MVNQQLLDYIISSLEQRQNPQSIKAALLQSGWKESDIDEGFQKVNSLTIPAPAKDNQKIPITAAQTTISPANAQLQYTALTRSSSKPAARDIRLPHISKPLLIILTVMLVSAGITGGGNFYLNKTKTEYKDISTKQVVNLNKVQETYTDIVDTIKKGQDLNKNKEKSQLLKYTTYQDLRKNKNDYSLQQVLGLEDTETIAHMRKLGELYKKGGSDSKELRDFNDEIRRKTELFPTNIIFPEVKNLTTKTSEFAKNNYEIFRYLEESNKIDIKYFTAAYEIGIALGGSIVQGADEESINNLEEKIKEVDEIEESYSSLDLSSLPTDLGKLHLKSLDQITKDKKTFNTLLAQMKDRDGEGLVKTFQAIQLDSLSAIETANVEIISFWQDNTTVRSVQEIKNEWQKFSSGL